MSLNRRDFLLAAAPQWPYGPPPSAGQVNVLLDLDRDRMKQLFVELMTKPI